MAYLTIKLLDEKIKKKYINFNKSNLYYIYGWDASYIKNILFVLFK